MLKKKQIKGLNVVKSTRSIFFGDLFVSIEWKLLFLGMAVRLLLAAF